MYPAVAHRPRPVSPFRVQVSGPRGAGTEFNRVTTLAGGGVAEAAGFRLFDRVVEVNGQLCADRGASELVAGRTVRVRAMPRVETTHATLFGAARAQEVKLVLERPQLREEQLAALAALYVRKSSSDVMAAASPEPRISV